MKRQTGHSGLAFSYLIGRCVALSIRLGFRLGFRAALRVGLLLGLLYRREIIHGHGEQGSDLIGGDEVDNGVVIQHGIIAVAALRQGAQSEGHGLFLVAVGVHHGEHPNGGIQAAVGAGLSLSVVVIAVGECQLRQLSHETDEGGIVLRHGLAVHFPDDGGLLLAGIGTGVRAGVRAGVLGRLTLSLFLHQGDGTLPAGPGNRLDVVLADAGEFGQSDELVYLNIQGGGQGAGNGVDGVAPIHLGVVVAAVRGAADEDGTQVKLLIGSTAASVPAWPARSSRAS